MSQQALVDSLNSYFGDQLSQCTVANDEVTIEIDCQYLRDICYTLKHDKPFRFELLLDVCGVDYLYYGSDDWEKESTTRTGYSRGVDAKHAQSSVSWHKPRFASVYHLLSLTHNQRLRIKTFPQGEPPRLDTVVDIWPSADWYEREVFDLYGILYEGHPDLRRILTDYGFIGHPFRKDFPLIGEVEMRYDATLGRCVYEPVSIEPRTLVPKVIRDDNRYMSPNDENGDQ